MKLTKKIMVIFIGIVLCMMILYTSASKIMMNYLYDGEGDRIYEKVNGAILSFNHELDAYRRKAMDYQQLMIYLNRIICEQGINAYEEFDIVTYLDRNEFSINVITNDELQVQYISMEEYIKNEYINIRNIDFKYDEEVAEFVKKHIPTDVPVMKIIHTGKQAYMLIIMPLKGDKHIEHSKERGQYFVGVNILNSKFFETHIRPTFENVEMVLDVTVDNNAKRNSFKEDKEIIVEYGENDITAYYKILQEDEEKPIYIKFTDSLVVKSIIEDNLTKNTEILLFIAILMMVVMLNCIKFSIEKPLNIVLKHLKKIKNLHKQYDDEEILEVQQELADIYKISDVAEINEINEQILNLVQQLINKNKKFVEYRKYCQSIIDNMESGYGYFKVNRDEQDQPQNITCLKCNNQMAKVFGKTIKDFEEDKYHKWVHEYIDYDYLWGMLDSIKSKKLKSISKKVTHINGATCKVTLCNYNNDKFQVLLKDFTENEIKKERIEELLRRDRYTEVFSREAMIKEMESLVEIKKEFAVYIVNFNNMKALDKVKGYKVVDEVTRDVAKHLNELSDTQTIVGRWSCVDFLIIRRGEVYATDIAKFSDNIHKKIKKEYIFEDYKFKLTATIGANTYPYDTQSIDKLIRNATIARNFANQKGTESSAIFNPSMYEKEKLIRQIGKTALKNHMQISYQPIVNASDRKTIGADVSWQWNYKEKYLEINDFIHLEEYEQYLAAMEVYVFEEACKFGVDIQKKTGEYFEIIMNLSRSTLYNSEYYARIIENIKSTEMQCLHIRIQVKETDLEHKIIKPLEGIKKLERGILLDDPYLQYSLGKWDASIKIDFIKIKQVLLEQVVEVPEIEKIVYEKIKAMEELGILTYCSHIEDEMFLDYAKEMGCCYLSGNHISLPLEKHLFEVFMETNTNELD
ncbi:MAG: EAL domain-containing protein [Cellulosilyticaceae bacterium]